MSNKQLGSAEDNCKEVQNSSSTKVPSTSNSRTEKPTEENIEVGNCSSPKLPSTAHACTETGQLTTVSQETLASRLPMTSKRLMLRRLMSFRAGGRQTAGPTKLLNAIEEKSRGRRESIAQGSRLDSADVEDDDDTNSGIY